MDRAYCAEISATLQMNRIYSLHRASLCHSHLALARMRQRDKENHSTNYETAKVIMKNWFAKFHIKCDVTIGMCTLDLNEPRNDWIELNSCNVRRAFDRPNSSSFALSIAYQRSLPLIWFFPCSFYTWFNIRTIPDHSQMVSDWLIHGNNGHGLKISNRNCTFNL